MFGDTISHSYLGICPNHLFKLSIELSVLVSLYLLMINADASPQGSVNAHSQFLSPEPMDNYHSGRQIAWALKPRGLHCCDLRIKLVTSNQ